LPTWAGQVLVRSFQKKVSINNNTDGFIANIITDKKETYGFGYGIDILECGICKLFSKHNYEKYSSILCEVDEVTSGLAGLKLIRMVQSQTEHPSDFVQEDRVNRGPPSVFNTRKMLT
jgi:hypothetical protein